MIKPSIFTPILSVALSALFLALTSCSDPVVPKPRGYFRITLPCHEYAPFEQPGVPFSFEHSRLSKVVADKSPNANDRWFNIVYPSLNCKIHITYLRLNAAQEDMAYEDNHRLLFKHTVAADAIVGKYFDNDEARVHAAIFNIKGNAATPAQFSITDSLGQVFRGSLYFFCHPNKDSLAPVVDYLDADISHLVETFRWQEN